MTGDYLNPFAAEFRSLALVGAIFAMPIVALALFDFTKSAEILTGFGILACGERVFRLCQIWKTRK